VALESLGTVEKALDVLFHLHAEGAPRGVTDIGRALGLPKSTAHRLVTALGRRGLVEADGVGRYRPGTALVSLGLGVLDREPVVALARPVLEREAEESGETLFLAGARAGHLLVLDKVEGTGFLRAAPRIGSEVPLHATAVGKLHLAFAPDRVRAEDPLPRFTPRTRTTQAALERECARTRRRGWAENREEWQPGLAVVAAPVLVGERLEATLALAAPAVRLPSERAPSMARRLRAAAGEIAARMGGAGA
jgi:DNA-binding IclR family transcriptional regulator